MRGRCFHFHKAPRIGFNQTEYTALESDRVATVYVSVLGDLQQRVTVAFSTEIRSSDSATGESNLFFQLCSYSTYTSEEQLHNHSGVRINTCT